jgi:MFS family permease
MEIVPFPNIPLPNRIIVPDEYAFARENHMTRSKFPGLFWIGNLIEILERFAYYGLYMGFAIFATTAVADGGMGLSKAELGPIQFIFLFLSYLVPLVSGVLADRYGFKRMLILSYLLYLPGFVFLVMTRNFFMVLMVMMLIGVAAGIFKPLIAGTVRLTTDNTNRTLGFGIFYLMVNVGAFFGPMTAGALRTMDWNYAFMASAIATVLMLAVTAIWYRDPLPAGREAARRTPLTKNLREIVPYLKDPRILVFIVIFGVFIEIPFWTFFNVVTMFVDQWVRTDLLYESFVGFFAGIGLDGFGRWFVGLFATVDANGTHRIAGETLGHTALYIIIFQMLVTRTSEKLRSIPVVALGIFIMVLGCVGLYLSVGDLPGLMFLGILLFAVGEMACMPRFEQYLISLLPPEKTGLGGGLLRIPIAIGALSALTTTPLYGMLETDGHPELTWLVVAGTLVVGFGLVLWYDRKYRSSH